MKLPLRSLAPCLLAHAVILAGCPANNTGDEGASTTEQGTAEHGTAEDGTTAHGTAEDGTTAHGTSEHGTAEDGIETSADDPAVVYCNCVFTTCHEPYHAKWGEDEMASEAACLAEAEALPVNGSDIEMGNFIECRMHFCELAADDESLCANALGDAVCM